MRRRLAVAAIVTVVLVASQTPAGARPLAGAHTCEAGFVHTLIGGKHGCVAAPDLRARVTGSPAANRVGGSFGYRVAVENRGRQVATDVVVSVDAAAEAVSVRATRGTCRSAPGRLRATCRLATLSPGASVIYTIAVRATALGPFRLTARTSSRSRDARPADNAATAAARVTEPDFVRGRGSRPSSHAFFRPPVVVEVEAISGPLGHDAAGTLFTAYSPLDVFNPGLEVRGRVVCLAVAGNRATIGAVVEETRNAPADRPFAPGSGILLLVTDNGEPGPGQDTMLTYFPAAPPTDCAVPSPGQNAPEIPLSEGNLVVHDERG